MNRNEFTSSEFTPFVGIVLLVVAILLYNYYRGYREFWSPLTIIALVYGYYCCVGPYQAVLTGETFDRLVNMRRFYPSALWGAFISLIAYVAGFFLYGNNLSKPKVIPSFSQEALFDYGRKIFIIGFVLFTISTGGNVAKLINPLDAEYVEKAGGTFGNYLALAVNFLIPGVTLLFFYFLITKKKVLWFVGTFILSAGLYTTLGFRYRLILMLLSMAIVYYYYLRKRPNLILLYVGFVVMVSVMGIISASRNYGSGLNVKEIKKTTTESAFKNGLEEAMIFQTSGAVIDYVPKRHPYAGFGPIWSTLLFPVPSKLIGDKNSAEYLFDMLDAIYGKKNSKGAAFLAYAEYYLAFGWAGLIIGCFITGWFLRKLWNWYLVNSNNLFVVATYAVTVPYLYVVISRGYLPQVTSLFFFTVFPVYMALHYAKKKYVIDRVAA